MHRWLWMLLAIACLLTGCSEDAEEPIAAVGRWVSDDVAGYYFELYEDGTCTMFDSHDEWVSAGTYHSDSDQITFDMDTGSFNWSKRDEGMVFESAGETVVFRREAD